MKEEIVYRKAKAGEEQQIIDLALKVFYDSIAPGYSDEGIAEFLKYCNTESFIERNRSNHFTLVAELDDKIIGVMEIRDYRHIALLFVDTSIQGKGVGKNLVEKVLYICRENNPQMHKLTAHSSPNAVAAYVKMGFVKEDDEGCENGIRYVPMVRWED